MYCVYILQSMRTDRFYIGITNDLNRRIQEHNRGKSSFAKAHRPFKVVYTEYLASRKKAYKREQTIKAYKGGMSFHKLING